MGSSRPDWPIAVNDACAESVLDRALDTLPPAPPPGEDACREDGPVEAVSGSGRVDLPGS